MAIRTTGVVISVLLIVAAALGIAAWWRGEVVRDAAALRDTAVSAPGGNDREQAAPPIEAGRRPDTGTKAADLECADLLPGGNGVAAQPGESRVDWIGRGSIEIDLSDNVEIIGRLASSDDPDHRLAAALMSASRFRSRAEQVEAVDAILARHPDHTLALWNLTVLCGRVLEHPACSDERLSGRAGRIDNENSEIWALLAAYRERRGDGEGAVRALQRATGSASTSSYYAEHILLFDRAYAAASDYGPSQRLLRAMGDLAAQPMQHTEIFDACQRLAKHDMVWRRMCFDYGQILESRARSLIAETFGLVLQGEMAWMDADEATAGEVRQRLERLGEFNVYDELGTISDDQLNARYLEQLSVHGERAALTFLRTEVEHRREILARCRESETAPALDQ